MALLYRRGTLYNPVMRTVLCCLVLLAPALKAEPTLINRLTSDIRALSAVSPLPNQPYVLDPSTLSPARYREFRSLVTEQAPELSAAMDRLADGLQQGYGRPLNPWNFAFALSTALAGRPIAERHARRLATSIVAALDRALECRERRAVLRDSEPFRAAVNDAFATLLDIGVSRRGAAVTAELLVNAGDQIVTRPLLRPTRTNQCAPSRDGQVGLSDNAQKLR